MADAQRVIEFLRDVRQGGLSNLQAASEEVAQMATQYAALCAQANERLRQCSVFLQQGLRSEAIHLAEQSPNLLDLVAQLDLPDPQAWAEFCQNNSLPVPPPLQFDRAAQLNDAYALEQPLEHLLARHRLLALSRAPVRERLGTLRKIAAIDTTTPHWENDQREFETARQKELPAEFATAVKRHDDAAIRALMQELSEVWLTPPPADLLAAVTDAHTRIQRTAVEVELRRLVEPLREAFAARSFQECQALLTRWKNTMSSGGVSQVSAELLDEIKPVAAFVSEQTKREEHVKRFNDACRSFAKLLDADSPDAALEAGYARLKEFREEVPEDLIKRYMAKKGGRRLAEDRRHKSRLMLIGSGATAAIVVGLVIAYLATRGHAAQQWADKIDDALKPHTKEGLDEAQRDADQLQQTNPGLLKEPRVAASVGRVQALRTKYEADQITLKTQLGTLATTRQAADTIVADPNAPIDSLRSAGQSLNDTLGTINGARESLAWADDGTLSPALAGASRTLKTMQERILAAVRHETDAIGHDLDAVPTTSTTPEAAARIQSQIDGLSARTDALRSMPLLDDDARGTLTALVTRIADRRTSSAATGDVAAELQRVRNANASAAQHKNALEAFISRFPDDAHTADFKTALRSDAPAQSFEAWLQLAAGYRDAPAVTGADMALKRAAEIDAFIAAHPNNPHQADAGAYAQYLHAAADAMGDKGTWQTAMADLLGNPLLNDLQVVQLSDRRVFYIRGDMKRQEHRLGQDTSVSFEAIDPDGIEKPDLKDPTKSLARRLIVTISAPVVVPNEPSPAPHARLMEDIRNQLKLIDEKNWDTYGIDLTDRIVNDAQIDLVVKAIFLQQVLTTQRSVTPGQYGTGDAYDRAISELSRQNPSELFWFDPSKISEGTRKSLTQIIAAIPSGHDVKTRLAQGRTALFKAIGRQDYTPGVLMRDDAGTWAVHTASHANAGVLWAVTWPASATTDADKAPTELVQIGTVEGAKAVLDDAHARTVHEGTIVYVTPR